MSKDDLISRKIAIGILGNSPEETCMPWGEVERMLRALPDVDAVTVVLGELVMCKNCKWWDKGQTTDGVKGLCFITGYCEKPDFFCADGERSDECETGND